MALKDAEVTVLGAGVAGLAVARALALRGARVTVLEQADAIREVGAGLQVSPNGAAVLRALGLGDALEAASVRARAVVLCDGLTGETVTRLDLGRLRPGQGWYLVHRADLIALLLEGAQAAGAELRLLQRIETVDLDGARPRLVTGQGAELATDLLIGADGLHSRLRATYEGGPRAPFFTHQIAWRTVIPGDPSDPAEVEVHMGPGRHLVSYPLRGGTLRNIVAVEERRRWAEEGWSLRDDPMEMRLAFADFGPRVQRWMEAAGEVWLWGLFRHPVARDWHRGGSSAILGDAAHPTLPFLAQGANLALEDAWVLGDCLQRRDDRAAALAAYQAIRAPRAARVVDAATRSARAYHLSGPLRSLAHTGLRLGGMLAPGMALSRYHWIHGHDVTAPRG
jgi:salicylate hydroxylase